MIEKVPVAPNRVRTTPAGFGWVDHRFVREGHIRNCTTDGLALYLVLATVADQQGVSFYGDALLCAMLGWSRPRLEAARSNLLHADLLAWEPPLYQILELPAKGGQHHDQ